MAEEVVFHCALAADALLFRSLLGKEELGRLPEYRLELLRPSQQEALKAGELLGKPAGISIKVDSRSDRHLHGLVTQFERGGALGRNDVYRLVLRPWLWLLTLGADFRVFQDRTAVQILDAVFAEYDSASPIDKRLTGEFHARPYTVQYRESDFDFVSRLMEDEGIYYYFRHEADQHTLVLCNSPSGHDPMQGRALGWSARQTGMTEREDVVVEWTRRHLLQSLKYTQTDFAAEAPDSPMQASAERSAPYPRPNDLEVFDYPGLHDDLAMAGNLEAKLKDGKRRAQLQVDRFESRHCVATGLTPYRGLMVGVTFDLRDHDDADNYLVVAAVTEIAYEGSQTNSLDSQEPRCTYACRFDAVPRSVPFQPAEVAPRPVVRGPETAIVVGPPGDEIHTDKYGRVRLRFHWDRVRGPSEKNACWVRVSHPWAGPQFGMVALPRVGDEVVVGFLAGNPDRPLVTGRVYNGDNMSPYALPAHATVSGIKSRSSKAGDTTTANELRFDDRKGAEYVWLQAERDFHQWVRHDAFATVKNDLSVDVTRDTDQQVGQDLTLRIGRQASLSVGADTHARLGADLHLGVGGALNLGVTDAVAFRGAAAVALAAGQALDIDAGAAMTLSAGAALNLSGLGVVIDGGTQLCIKAGGAFITLGPEGVTLQGAQVRINSGGAADSARPAATAKPAAPRQPGPPGHDQDPLDKA